MQWKMSFKDFPYPQMSIPIGISFGCCLRLVNPEGLKLRFIISSNTKMAGNQFERMNVTQNCFVIVNRLKWREQERQQMGAQFNHVPGWLRGKLNQRVIS